MRSRLLLLITALAYLPFSGIAQQIPNGDMEDWLPLVIGTGEKPVGWDSPDVIGAALGLADRVVEKETASVQSGSAAAKLTTKTLVATGLPPLTIPGTLVIGTIVFDPLTLEAGVIGGMAISEVADALVGYYKYFPAPGDTMSIGVQLFQDGTIVGGGEFNDATEKSTYTMFEVPIATAGTPDSMQVILLSSGSFAGAIAGSILYIDNMTLTGLSSIDFLAGSGLKPNIYPNPAYDVINILNPLDYNVEMEVYNISGSKVDYTTLTPEMNAINVSNYASGLYMFRLMNNGEQIFAGKFKVSK
ncbi:MAG: T9SS type A sorting domain-containing protein [Chitinophagales bacterium]|nr:T9SS type A sorting domain-containing protein [Bacteroidota bacterium]MBK8488200.1 T9SS type A sorting domain-containing protein [Bacteroidota bacterium]MBK8682039.1 T9SS type A sorting domain-containing protein [Bacteroidota bacterium]